MDIPDTADTIECPYCYEDLPLNSIKCTNCGHRLYVKKKRSMNTQSQCPKCGFKRNKKDSECPKCGIIYVKFKNNISKSKKHSTLNNEQFSDKHTFLSDASDKQVKKGLIPAEPQNNNLNKIDQEAFIKCPYCNSMIGKKLFKCVECGFEIHANERDTYLNLNEEAKLTISNPFPLNIDSVDSEKELDKGPAHLDSIAVPYVKAINLNKLNNVSFHRKKTTFLVIGWLTIVAGLLIGVMLVPDSYENKMRILASEGQDYRFAIQMHKNFESGRKTLTKHDWEATNKLRKEYNLKRMLAYSCMIGGGILGVLIILYGSRLKEDKICPYCFERIKLEASSCRYCGKVQITDKNSKHMKKMQLLEKAYKKDLLTDREYYEKINSLFSKSNYDIQLNIKKAK